MKSLSFTHSREDLYRVGETEMSSSKLDLFFYSELLLRSLTRRDGLAVMKHYSDKLNATTTRGPRDD